MRVYADSSFILRLVTAEPGSEEAIAEYRHLAHVACALQLGSELFLTFDRCQQRLAAAAGLDSAKFKVPR